MNPIVLVCLLASTAFAVPQGYGYGSSYEAASGWGYQQPATSQAYAGPGQMYQSQPVAYRTPSVTFNPPQIQYSQPSVTYSTPSQVAVAMPAQYGGSYGSSTYNNQQPVILGYQPTNNYGSSGYKRRR